MRTINELVKNHNLCIGCGLCAASCPVNCIEMRWDDKQKWVPIIDGAKCTNCGLCTQVCPNSPICISEFAVRAAKAGERFGLQDDAKCFISYDLDMEKRLKSTSGGTTNALLTHLLATGKVDGVIVSVPVMAPIGEPKFELKLLTSLEVLDKARSSHYYPVTYHKSLRDISKKEGRYALTGPPCIIRGVEKLPANIRAKIKYTFGLVCSHNVTGQFLDCLAKQQGITEGETFLANFRDKKDNPDAGNYNNYFKLGDREIRVNRFQNKYTDMWRNYFFAHECCLYCPDFYGADADFSAKDAWGRLSKDPHGISLIVVRNRELVDELKTMANDKKLYLEESTTDEIFNSQVETAVFKHLKVRDRLVWKPAIRDELVKCSYPLGTSKRQRADASKQYHAYMKMMKESDSYYSGKKEVPVKKIIENSGIMALSTPKKPNLVRRVKGKARRKLAPLFSPIYYSVKPMLKYKPVSPPTQVNDGKFRVLIAGGFGYRNVGDEAQLSNVLKNWKRFRPDAELTILSPNPEYTEKEHGEHSELAPRVTLFQSNSRSDYGKSNALFKLRFSIVKPRLLKLAKDFKRGNKIRAHPHEVKLLKLLRDADVFHLSGGGYLTGMTLSRLWENMLLIRIADILGTPVILSGHTIGVFKDRRSKKLARWGLQKAKLIYVRDPEGSIKDLASIGIKGTHVKATFDDALFCESATDSEIAVYLNKSGLKNDSKFAAVQVHNWGLSKDEYNRVITRTAEIFDYLHTKHHLEILFVPMHPSDIPSMEDVQMKMTQPSAVLNYDYDFKINKGVIGKSEICLAMKHHTIIFAMAKAVPTISFVFDDYYERKNAGAMKIFKQESHVLNRNSFYAKGIFEKEIDQLIQNKTTITKEINNKLEKLKEIDGGVIKRFIGNDISNKDSEVPHAR